MPVENSLIVGTVTTPRAPLPPMGRQVILTFPPIYKERGGGTTRQLVGQTWPRLYRNATSGSSIGISTSGATSPDFSTGGGTAPIQPTSTVIPATVSVAGSVITVVADVNSTSDLIVQYQVDGGSVHVVTPTWS